jgi:mono/diheme cytochrome c family protein
MKFVLGIVVGLLLVPIVGFLYIRYGNPPVAVADTPFPYEKQIVHIPLNARIHRDMPHTVPIEATPANLIAGAQIYHDQCAECHGVYGHPTDYAAHMYPPAPQLWWPHAWNTKVVGVSDDPPGVTYWKVANGIRLTGMPSFDHVLSTTQMWQVTLLLKHADEALPAQALAIVKEPIENTSKATQATPNVPPLPAPAAPAGPGKKK